MAYDRFDSREDRSRWQDNRDSDRFSSRGHDPRGGRNERDERGFFERAGDEVASWFGDDDAERRRREDRMHDEHGQGSGGRDREPQGGWMPHNDRSERSAFRNRDDDRGDGRDRERDRNPDRSGDWNQNRGVFARGGSSERDYNRGWREEFSGGPGRRDYRPMTGDYGRREERPQSEWARDEYRSTSRAGTSDKSDRSRHEDPHYDSWRQRHMSELDRDYDDYRREHQSKFESDFGSWRDRRQQKRGLLGQIREQMEVVGNDDQHVGTIDKVAGDRIILTKSDPESGGVHHSLSCSEIDRVEGDRVILDCSADEARNSWRDESRSRALFEREDSGEMGPRVLDRSFEGTYR
jgi:hypothetical protein